MLLVTKTRYFGREVGPSLALFVETKTNDFRQEIKPPAVLLAKETSFFWWQKKQLFLGKLDHFCVDQNCVFHSGWKAISSHVAGHLQPCYWQAKPTIFSLEFGPSLGIFVPIKWLFFHRKSAYLQLLYWQNWPLLTEVRPSPGIL